MDPLTFGGVSMSGSYFDSYFCSLVSVLISALVLGFLEKWEAKPFCLCFATLIQDGSVVYSDFKLEVFSEKERKRIRKEARQKESSV